MNEKWIKKRELIILRFYRKIQIIFNAICLNLYVSLDTNLSSLFCLQLLCANDLQCLRS